MRDRDRVLHGRQAWPTTKQDRVTPGRFQPELIYELGVHKVAQTIRVYQNIAEYKRSFPAPTKSLAFTGLRDGQSRYITAVSGQQTTHVSTGRLLRFKTGELVTDDQRMSRRCVSMSDELTGC